MEVRFHHRLQDHLHDRLRHAIGDRRNAQGARAAALLRYLDEPHGRREVRARRHPIPDLVEVALQVLSRMPPATRHPRPQRHGSPSPAGTPPRRVASECRKALPQAPAPPIAGWPTSSAGSSGPFAPPALPGFVATTSPSAPAPRIGTRLLMGSTTWRSPLASRRQVPTFRTRACAGLTPSSCRSPLGQSAGILPSFVPGQQLEPGFDDVPTLSTRHQRFTRVRLPSAHLTGCSRLFRNAHHPGHWTDAACGGLDPDPAIRVRGADPHLLCSKAAQELIVT